MRFTPAVFYRSLPVSRGWDGNSRIPDWPNSFGYNMFLFPGSRSVSGVFFERTPRLIAVGPPGFPSQPHQGVRGCRDRGRSDSVEMRQFREEWDGPIASTG